MEEKKVLLSVKDLYVKFRVRGRVLTAIRGVSLDIYENESIAIVGESGCGKSVLTKTFAGMLDNNGFIDHGGIYFHDEEFIDTVTNINPVAARMISGFEKRLNEDSKLELGSATYREILALEKDGGTVSTTSALAAGRPEGSVLISESGIHSPADVKAALSAGADAVLVGTAIWQAEDPVAFYRELSTAEGKSK